jgi:hypothetical protein
MNNWGEISEILEKKAIEDEMVGMLEDMDEDMEDMTGGLYHNLGKDYITYMLRQLEYLDVSDRTKRISKKLIQKYIKHRCSYDKSFCDDVMRSRMFSKKRNKRIITNFLRP